MRHGGSREPGTRSLGRVLTALAIGLAGGFVAYRMSLPLAWMIGAMVSVTVAAIGGVPIGMWSPLRALMVAILGVLLGSGFTPEILPRLPEWFASLSALLLYTVVSAALGSIYFQRFTRYDPTTAYFCAMPGGLSEMIIVGSAMGGDSRLISLTHASRILLVVLTLPFAYQIILGYQPGSDSGGGNLFAFDVPPTDLALLVLCGALGYGGARMIGLPAAAVVGPMILSAGVHLAGLTEAQPPMLVIAAAQVVIGTAIGCRFAGTDFAFVRRAVANAAGVTVLMIGITLAFAFALAWATDLPLEALVLAFSPGGLAEMSLIALALNIDSAFVATHHIVRIFLIVVLAPGALRFWRRRG